MIRGVVFDLGGVVLESPLSFISDFERQFGVEPNLVARVVGGYAMSEGPWQRLERGEISLREFCSLFDEDLARAGAKISTETMMSLMAQHGKVRDVMIEAIGKLRQNDIKVAALTNNWASTEDHDARMQPLREQFDIFIESYKVGMRKPEARIYQLVVDQLGLTPPEVAFLDDIGSNLKAARQLGLHTIKVDDPRAALAELANAVGVALLT
jgi:epoxide hydrolase-like predicted phosphatase